jgi:uncharacterized delta-60 repeat protein
MVRKNSLRASISSSWLSRRLNFRHERKHEQRFRLSLELLEDRTLLSPILLDPTFGTGGRVTTDFTHSSNDSANSVAIVPAQAPAAGKIVVAGGTGSSAGADFAVARYNSDGSLDSSFGVGGLVTIDFGSASNGANGVAVMNDGRIVVVGVTNQAGTGNDFAVARLTSNGTLDDTFGSLDSTGLHRTGKQIIDFGASDDEALGVALQPDGSIVVGGYSNQATTGYDFAVARLTPDGTIDDTFGSLDSTGLQHTGKQTIDFRL